jgi:hypothetical protein
MPHFARSESGRDMFVDNRLWQRASGERHFIIYLVVARDER